MLEVLEHVRDPEKALLHLGEVLPDDALLLVSVPLLRRLEHVWGHHELFEIGRVRHLFETAGFAIQDVDTLHDTWLLVVASKQPGPHARVLDALDAKRVGRVPESSRAHHFGPVELTEAKVKSVYTRNADATFEVTGRGKARARARAGWLPVASTVGLRLPVPEMAVARIEVELDPVSALSELTLIATGGGRTLGSWSVDRRHLQAWVGGNPTFRRTFVLRAGEPYGPILPRAVRDGVISDLHVVARLRRGHELQMELHRSAFVGGARPVRAPGWNPPEPAPNALVTQAKRYARIALRRLHADRFVADRFLRRSNR
jgi:hypothetical protein